MSLRHVSIAVSCLVAFMPIGRAATVAVAVDVSLDRRAIDPRIYGVNFGDADRLQDPGYTLRRWGGNATTRYNWQVDVSNRGSDYFYLNVPEGDGLGLPDQSGANRFLSETLAAGAEPILTIGTIGWTPIALRQKRYGFSIAKYGAQFANGCPFDCDGGNGVCSTAQNATGFCVDQPAGSDLIVGNDPTDTSFASGAQWTRDWVAHLKARHGTASDGGVRLYALDNEVMLWNSTHRDVHPQPATYDEVWQRTLAHAPTLTQADANSIAWRQGVRLLKRAIEKRLDFTFETTLGGNTITSVLVQAAEQSIEVRVWYVGLFNPELHVARVQARVSRGGHDIPARDIHRRYEHSRLKLVQCA